MLHDAARVGWDPGAAAAQCGADDADSGDGTPVSDDSDDGHTPTTTRTKLGKSPVASQQRSDDAPWSLAKPLPPRCVLLSYDMRAVTCRAVRATGRCCATATSRTHSSEHDGRGGGAGLCASAAPWSATTEQKKSAYDARR